MLAVLIILAVVLRGGDGHQPDGGRSVPRDPPSHRRRAPGDPPRGRGAGGPPGGRGAGRRGARGRGAADHPARRRVAATAGPRAAGVDAQSPRRDRQCHEGSAQLPPVRQRAAPARPVVQRVALRQPRVGPAGAAGRAADARGAAGGRRAAATAGVPMWLPWPLPRGWLVTGRRHGRRRAHRRPGDRGGLLRPGPARRGGRAGAGRRGDGRRPGRPVRRARRAGRRDRARTARRTPRSTPPASRPRCGARAGAGRRRPGGVRRRGAGLLDVGRAVAGHRRLPADRRLRAHRPARRRATSSTSRAGRCPRVCRPDRVGATPAPRLGRCASTSTPTARPPTAPRRPPTWCGPLPPPGWTSSR